MLASGFALNAFLISIRLLPVMVVSPIVLFARIPLFIRLVVSLAIAAVLVSAVPITEPPRLSFSIVLGEFALGAVTAFGFHTAHAGLDVAGKMLDTQIGLNASGVFDPGTSNITSLIADLLALVFAVLFVTLDFHHALLRAMSEVLSVAPPGSVSLSVLSISLTAVLTQQFLTAVMIVAPVMIGLWLTDIAFALLSRSMPQANIYFLALPIKLGLGVFLLILTLPLIVRQIPLLFENALHFVVAPGVGGS